LNSMHLALTVQRSNGRGENRQKMKPAWPITIFADEVDSAFAAQAEFIRSEGLDGLDLRNANGRNVTALRDSDLAEIKASGTSIQCLGSPVGKTPLDEAHLEGELLKLMEAVRVGRELGCRRIRIFSPEPAKDGELARVIKWLRPMVELAEKEDVILLHENDAHFFGAHPADSQGLFAEYGGPHFRAAFDFSNTILIGHKVWDEWFPWVLPHLDTLHIKDSIHVSQQIVPAGEGDGEIPRTLKWLAEQGWEGPLTLEPHLKAAGRLGGFSGAELCRTAHRALKTILEEM
jgi:3-dehydroshikimate dehydratase